MPRMSRLISAAMLAALHFAAAALPPSLPKDVTACRERRESCEHWLGEEGYDKERQAEINRAICQTCPGTDQQLLSLKKKHKRNPDVMKALGGLDPRIEPSDSAATQFCSATRKPAEAK